jgi:hypothetical protein
MSAMPSTSIVALAAVLTAAVLALVFVTGGNDEPSEPTVVPTEFVTYDGEHAGARFSFSYPAELGEVTQRPGSATDEVFFEVGASGGDEDAPVISLGIQPDSASPEAILQANIAGARAQGADVEVSEEEPVDVAGAVEALRAEATYTGTDADGESAEFRTVIQAAAAPDETVFLLTVSAGADAGFDPEAVAGSLSIEPAPAGEATDV